MVKVYGPDESRLPKNPYSKKKYIPTYLARKVGDIRRLFCDHHEVEEWTMQLDHEVLHIIHTPVGPDVDDVALPIRVITLPYSIWEEFVRWYGREWWVKKNGVNTAYRKARP